MKDCAALSRAHFDRLDDHEHGVSKKAAEMSSAAFP